MSHVIKSKIDITLCERTNMITLVLYHFFTLRRSRATVKEDNKDKIAFKRTSRLIEIRAVVGFDQMVQWCKVRAFTPEGHRFNSHCR